MSLFHIYALGLTTVTPYVLRAAHLGFTLILIWLVLPRPRWVPPRLAPWLDGVLVALSAAVAGYAIVFHEDLMDRITFAATPLDLLFAVVTLVLVLEATRRTTGWAMPLVAIAFVLYALLGDWVPGTFGHKGYDLARVLGYSYSVEGIFGIPLGASATFIFLFVVFGAFLKESGAGQFFLDFATSLFGHVRGGPGKISVVASSLFGTISGSAVANVVVDGYITIPLMKGVGYRGHVAAAIEAVASTGGQIMPPVMGAGAFILAEIVGVPYARVALAAALPAILYYTALFSMIDLEAVRGGIHGVPREKLPPARKVLAEGSHLLVPVLALIYVLAVAHMTAIRAALVATACTVVVSWVRRHTRMGWRKVGKSLIEGAKGVLDVAAACACAGIIVGIVSLTGLGIKLAGAIVDLAYGHMVLALAFAMLVALLLGMGLPTTPSYIICAAVVAPALVKLGLPMLSAHLFVFYFACIAVITPPVALAAYAAAGIARENPWAVGIEAVRLGFTAFIVPYMFVYGPALLWEGGTGEIIWAAITATIGVFALAFSLEGYGWILGPLGWPARCLFFAAALLLIKPGLATDLAGFAAIALALGVHAWLRRRQYAPAAVSAAPAVSADRPAREA
jgi:TRAP transporter 4TM/12TM fusion protein